MNRIEFQIWLVIIVMGIGLFGFAVYVKGLESVRVDMLETLSDDQKAAVLDAREKRLARDPKDDVRVLHKDVAEATRLGSDQSSRVRQAVVAEFQLDALKPTGISR